jgi:hypothetical protein
LPTIPIWISKEKVNKLDKKCAALGLNRYKAGKEAMDEWLEKDERGKQAESRSGTEGRGQETVKVSY